MLIKVNFVCNLVEEQENLKNNLKNIFKDLKNITVRRPNMFEHFYYIDINY